MRAQHGCCVTTTFRIFYLVLLVGEGVYTWPDSATYKGNWKQNKMHGEVRWAYSMVAHVPMPDLLLVLLRPCARLLPYYDHGCIWGGIWHW